MLDFHYIASLDQDVFQYMTDNKMYEMLSSSNATNIDFAIQTTGRSLIPKSPQETLDKLLANGRQKDAIFTVNVEECVTGLRQDPAIPGQVVKCERDTTRTQKVR